MTTAWVIISVIADVLFWVFVGPHVPPGHMTETAINNQRTFNVLLVIALPVLIGVWIYLGYAIVVWGSKRNSVDSIGGESARTNRKAQTSWIVVTSVVVLILAGYGSYAVIAEHGSGGGEGPNPVWTPSGAAQAQTAALAGTQNWSPGSKNVLPVQVIGQQWKFTYRYPTFGGFETTQLILPVNTEIAFNVTSLDVIHSFWAYQLSVKADANPQVNDVAYTETKQMGNFVVRCSELCGIWHGSMYNYGKVVSQSDFMNWATTTEAANAANTKLLPPFAWTYVPDANGASGGYYPDGKQTPYSTVELYGSKTPAS
ncbi:MAG: cytochrome c oxidase subunit II [Acidimicrobiaceae bacterium]|nr:cytochrome c oxidase subunit II [Acidimicrobiaceae bacterium]